MQTVCLLSPVNTQRMKTIYSFENFDAFYYESFRVYCEALHTFYNKIPESKPTRMYKIKRAK